MRHLQLLYPLVQPQQLPQSLQHQRQQRHPLRPLRQLWHKLAAQVMVNLNSSSSSSPLSRRQGHGLVPLPTNELQAPTASTRGLAAAVRHWMEGVPQQHHLRQQHQRLTVGLCHCPQG